jgi:hypothetical protein
VNRRRYQTRGKEVKRKKILEQKMGRKWQMKLRK